MLQRNRGAKKATQKEWKMQRCKRKDKFAFFQRMEPVNEIANDPNAEGFREPATSNERKRTTTAARRENRATQSNRQKKKNTSMAAALGPEPCVASV